MLSIYSQNDKNGMRFTLRLWINSINCLSTVHICEAWSWHYTYTRLTALFLGLPGWVGIRKVNPIWILLEQEIVSGSGISWAMCKSASRSRQITMPVPHNSSFLQARCPSCCQTNSVKALMALIAVAKFSKSRVWGKIPMTKRYEVYTQAVDK